MEEICEKSTKLVTLIDLAGHHKYLKTTILGLTGYSPDFAMLVVSANAGLGKESEGVVKNRKVLLGCLPLFCFGLQYISEVHSFQSFCFV